MVEWISHNSVSRSLAHLDGTEGFQGFSLPLTERDAIR